MFVAVSTANADVGEEAKASFPSPVDMHPNSQLTALFEATIDATEEAIVNALVAGEPGEGANRFHVPRLPHARLREILKAHNLLTLAR